MKTKLFDTDYVLWDKANDHLYSDSYGRVIIFGSKQEAEEDCCGNETITKCTDLPEHHQKEILKQLI